MLKSLSRLYSCVLLVALAQGCSGKVAEPPASANSPLQSRNLPEFRRPTLRGEVFDTAALSGRVVVVKFFAKHCIPCRRTLPATQALHRDHPEVAVVGVSEDDDARSAEEQVRMHRLTFPVVLDQGNVLAGRFRVSELPAAFVTDRRGRIAWVAGPGQSEDDLRRAVEWLSQ